MLRGATVLVLVDVETGVALSEDPANMPGTQDAPRSYPDLFPFIAVGLDDGVPGEDRKVPGEAQGEPVQGGDVVCGPGDTKVLQPRP